MSRREFMLQRFGALLERLTDEEADWFFTAFATLWTKTRLEPPPEKS